MQRGRGTSLVAGATLATYLQILLGALVRHTGSGPVCGVDPWLCQGALWPPFGPGQLQMAHRMAGLAVLVVVAAAAHRGWREAGPRGRWLALVAVPCTLLQLLLGVVTVTSGIALLPVSAHLAVGALLLADLFLLWRSLWLPG